MSTPSVTVRTSATVLVCLVAACGGNKPADDPANAQQMAMAQGQQPPPGQGQWQQPPPGQPQGQWQQPPPGQPQGQWQQPPPGQPQGQWQQPPPGQPQGQPQGQWQQPPPGQQPQGQPAPAGLPMNPMDPAFLQQAAAAAAAMMQPPPGPVTTDPAELGIKALAAKHAPKMEPDGPEAKQPLTEGQRISMAVTLQGGRCYTFIGFSPPGAVRDLDLTLLGPAPMFNMSAGQDGTKDGSPVIGSGKNALCPVLPFPAQYRLDIFAKSGSGPVVVQMYSRPK